MKNLIEFNACHRTHYILRQPQAIKQHISHGTEFESLKRRPISAVINQLKTSLQHTANLILSDAPYTLPVRSDTLRGIPFLTALGTQGSEGITTGAGTVDGVRCSLVTTTKSQHGSNLYAVRFTSKPQPTRLPRPHPDDNDRLNCLDNTAEATDETQGLQLEELTV